MFPDPAQPVCAQEKEGADEQGEVTCKQSAIRGKGTAVGLSAVTFIQSSCHDHFY